MADRPMPNECALPASPLAAERKRLVCRCSGCWTMDLKSKSVTAAEKCRDLYDTEACILHGPGYSKKVFWFELLPKWRAANSTALY